LGLDVDVDRITATSEGDVDEIATAAQTPYLNFAKKRRKKGITIDR
jgi:hypothetical protein